MPPVAKLRIFCHWGQKGQPLPRRDSRSRRLELGAMSSWVWTLLSGQRAGCDTEGSDDVPGGDQKPDTPLDDRPSFSHGDYPAASNDMSDPVILDPMEQDDAANHAENDTLAVLHESFFDEADSDLPVLENTSTVDDDNPPNGESGTKTVNFMVVGTHYSSCEEISQECRSYAKAKGFAIATNPHAFSKEYPHPILGSDSVAIQRCKMYCSFKDPVIKKQNKGVRTTCTWFVQYSFDRAALDYCITKVCLEHNHQLEPTNPVVAGRLIHVKLAKELLEPERLMILQFSRYNLPLFKV